MERFDIGGSEWGIKHRTDGLGAFTWADTAQWYKRLYHRQLYVNAAVVMICVLLSAYIAVHKHDPVPVQKVSEEEYQAVLQLERQAQTEKATLRKQLADEHARRLLGDKMIKSLNATVAQHQQQLKDLQTSVPSQPIIVEAIRKELRLIRDSVKPSPDPLGVRLRGELR